MSSSAEDIGVYVKASTASQYKAEPHARTASQQLCQRMLQWEGNAVTKRWHVARYLSCVRGRAGGLR